MANPRELEVGDPIKHTEYGYGVVRDTSTISGRDRGYQITFGNRTKIIGIHDIRAKCYVV